ncbi:MAG TPA: hypothetical protein VJP45_14970 [Candidatus Limnocylindria bacterium]|nr:hypothetical protein [Candidatus Limnocylindria bacterium]
MRTRRRRGSILRAIRNFTDSEIPLPRRVAVASRNLLLRVTRRRGCCGHDGEPGC